MNNEKIQEIKKALEVWGNKGIGYFDNNDVFHSVKHNEILDYINELEDKIENGTLIEFPKKCYWVVDILGWVIIEYDVQKISYSFENNKINYIHCQECNSRRYKYFDSKDLDDDVFLTKAEAEKKLAEKKLKE